MAAVDPVAAATYFVQEIGATAFPVWGSRKGKCNCGDPHDGTGKHGPDNVGKHPATLRGFKDATADLGAIATFLHNPGTPNYGLNAPPGVLVIDVDGKDGLVAWEALQARYGPLPATLTTTTANGRHYFFRWPAEAGDMPTGKLFGFVVRRHDDGYVIGPGSVHPSGTVYDTLRQPSGMPYPMAELPRTWASEAQATKPFKIVAGGLPQVGQRHDWLRDTARLYAGTVRDPDALKAAIMAENAKLPEPKSEAEVDRAIGAVLTKFGPDPVDETSGTVERADELGLLPMPSLGGFPDTPAAIAFAGLLGECVHALAGGTDASLVGLLGSLVAFCGALIPGSAYFHRTQTSSPFIALVGESSVGRKGTAMMRAHDAVSDALGVVNVNRVVLDGLNSGEGLVTTMAWKQTTFPYEPAVGLVFEEEYASLLASRGREGSTLDPKMRAAFDGGPLSNRKSNETKSVTPPYWLPALIGITPSELRARLEPGALQSGSANRWLYLPVVRRAVQPTNELPVLPGELQGPLRDAWRVMKDKRPALHVEPGVTAILAEYSDFLGANGSGLARDLTRRLGIIAFRVALVHALVERSEFVSHDHVDRALALTEYARSGLSWVFGDIAGNRDAVLLQRALQANGSLRKNTITRQLIRDPLRQQDAIDELIRLGIAKVATVYPEHGGRPRSELQLAATNQSFVHFVHDESRASIGRNWTKRSDDGSESRSEPWTKLDETASQGVSSRNPAPSESEPRSPDSVDERDETPISRSKRLDETGTKRGRNVDALDETPASEPVIDQSTGEVQDAAEATWVEPCRAYEAHRFKHRRTDAGWICEACQSATPTEGTP